MSPISNLVYALVFQVGWFICIMAGNLAAFGYTVIFLICHFYVVLKSDKETNASKEIFWVIFISSFGLCIEIISFSIGLLRSDTPGISFSQLSLPPLWLFFLWVMFSLALRTCLSFLFKKPIVSYLLCFVFVPINYYAGAKLNDDVSLAEPYLLKLALIAIMWILFLWCITQLKRRYFEELFNAS